MSLTWETPSAKAQLRLTSQSLRQLQDRKDAHGFSLRRNIATLLRQRNIWLARAKAQDLLVEQSSSDLLERLEMYIRLLLEHFNQLDLKSSLSPNVLEAVETIVHVAPRIESRDLQAVRNLLINHLESDFVSSAMTIQGGNHVSPIVIRALAHSTPSAIEINACLQEIASDSGVSWEPEPTRHDVAYFLSNTLSGSSSSIDISALRISCRHGIPDEPVWLRPRIWKLLLGMISPVKEAWPTELKKRRNDYYDLVRQLLGRFSALEASASPLDPLLLDILKQLSRIPSNLFIRLESASDISSFCPLDPNAPDNIRIPCANHLELRLAMLQDEQRKSCSTTTPEIRVEMETSVEDVQAIRNPDTANQESRSTVSLSKAFCLPYVQPRHQSALLRILYVHATINSGILSPHVLSLLVPLYTVLTQESEPEESAHAEADAFWLFEAMLGEFNEFEDAQATNMWLSKFGERVAWADRDIFDFLQVEGLDPSLPHYSYRWLATILTHTLPLSSIILVWDVLFSCPMRTRSTDYKMDHLLDICTAMLLCLRSELFRLGGNATSSHLSGSEQDSIKTHYHPKSSDTFMEGMAALQNYRVEAAGGIDRILQTASDLLQRRLSDHEDPKEAKLGLGGRVRGSMWKGFIKQLPAEPSKLLDDDNESSQVEIGTASSNRLPSFTSRLATTVWKGITNQTAMEPPPSPPPSQSPPASPSTGLPVDGIQWSNAYNGMWDYAEKLKESDAVATFSKVSSNWKARALIATLGQSYQKIQENSQNVEKSSPSRLSGLHHLDADDASSLLSLRSYTHSPPSRPAHFYSPCDISPKTEQPSLYLNTSTTKSAPDAGIISKTGASLAAFIRSVPPTPKSAPRPLLLSSTSLVAPASQGNSSRSPYSAPTLGQHDRVDYSKFRRTDIHRDSLSSISSLSTSEAVVQSNRANTSDRDSDTSGPSRRILLNRKSVSPLALKYRSQRSANSPRTSSVTSSDVCQESSRDVPQCPFTNADIQGRISDSSSFKSPPVPYTPSSAKASFKVVEVNESERQRGSVLLEDLEEQMLATVPPPKRSLRRKPPADNNIPDNTPDSPIVRLPTRSVRIRTRKGQPTNLPLQTGLMTPDMPNKVSSLDNTLKVEWPEDQDTSTTPRASEFDLIDQQSVSPKYSRKLSTEKKTSADGREIRIRKVSNGQRTRKLSSENREEARKSRDSAAEEGDDEGYDDLLSAYESEEGAQILCRT